jgi:hypothetical protein
MDDFISKPVDPEDLFKVMLKWLSHRARHALVPSRTSGQVEADGRRA